MKRFRFSNSILILGLVVLFTGCRQKTGPDIAILSGNIVPYAGSYLTVVRVDTSSYTPVDSVKAGRDGAFTLALKLQMPGIYHLRINGKAIVPVVIHPGDKISLNFRNDSVDIGGGIEAGLFNAFRQKLKAYEEVVDSLGTVLILARDLENYEAVRTGADSAYYQMMQKAKADGISYIRANPASLSQLLVLNSKIQQAFLFDQIPDSALFFYTDSLLLNRFPLNQHVLFNHKRIVELRQVLSQERAARANMMAGRKAPELVLPGLNGKPVRLDPSVNNFTLVYFWAPTDGLSRKSNHELKSIHDLYKNSGFEVFAVSFDAYKDRWAAAVNLDKLWWINVNDTLGLNSPVSKSWIIQKLPVFVLLDQNGEIIDRYTSVRNLGERLSAEYRR